MVTGSAIKAIGAIGEAAIDAAKKVLDLLKSGRADEVTTSMYEQADKNYLIKNYDLPTDTASKKARGIEQDFNLDTPRYHGGFNDIEAMAPLGDIRFQDNPGGTYSSGTYSGPGLYTTTNPEDAYENYASISGPDVRQKITSEIDRLTDPFSSFETNPADFIFYRMSDLEIKNLEDLLNHSAITDRGDASTKVDSKNIKNVISEYKNLMKKDADDGGITTGDFENFEDAVNGILNDDGMFPPGFAQSIAERRVTNNYSSQVLQVVDRANNPVTIRGSNATFLEGGPPKQDIADYIDDAEIEIKRSAYADEIEYREAVQERAEELSNEYAFHYEPEGPAVDLIESVLDQLDYDMYGGTVDEISKSLYARMYEDGGIAIDDVENIVKANYDPFDDDSDSAAIILNKAYRAAGFDAIDMPNPRKVFHFGPSGATHRVELDPSKVRVPSAMFDPRLKHLPNITASVPAAGVLGYGALQGVGGDDGNVQR
jgi:hypothetical protein|tara:strand:- start:7 stop:1461 length:1455 start_codon:yes stop_codon:yes gene_type:complete